MSDIPKLRTLDDFVDALKAEKGLPSKVRLLAHYWGCEDLFRRWTTPENVFHLLKELMSKSNEHGMQTFDQALFRLYKEGAIEEDKALAHADSRNDLRLMIKLDADGGDALAAAPELSVAGVDPEESKGRFMR